MWDRDLGIHFVLFSFLYTPYLLEDMYAPAHGVKTF
jgi:hypothetical protein